VPLFDGADAVRVGLPTEDQGADDVEAEAQGDADGDESGPGPKPKAVKLAHEEGGHETGLEGTDAAAGFVYANRAGGKLDEVAALEGGNVEPSQKFDGQIGDHAHEALSQALFNAVRPDDSDEDEADREGEMSDPRGEGGPRTVDRGPWTRDRGPWTRDHGRRTSKVKGIQSEGDDDEGVEPTYERPITVDLVDHAEGKQEEK